MSATVRIYRYNGSGPSSTDITGINTRVDGSDNVSTGETTNPVPIPASGTNNSYWCATGLICTVAPATQINNLQWYTNGTNNLGTGVGCNVGQATGYTQATGSGGIGAPLTTGNYSTLTGSPSNAFAYTSGSPLAVAGSTSTTGPFGNYVVYQFTVGSTAGPGPTGQPTFTWQYDEF